MVWSVLVFDLKTESEWGEPGPPTADQDHQDQLGPCMCTPRRHRCKFFRDDPILRTSDTCFSLTEIRPVPWRDPAFHLCRLHCRRLGCQTRTSAHRHFCGAPAAAVPRHTSALQTSKPRAPSSKLGVNALRVASSDGARHVRASSRRVAAARGAACSPSGCCSQTASAHLQAASQRRWAAAGPAGYPPCILNLRLHVLDRVG